MLLCFISEIYQKAEMGFCSGCVSLSVLKSHWSEFEFWETNLFDQKYCRNMK